MSSSASSVTRFLRFVDEHGKAQYGEPTSEDDVSHVTILTGDPYTGFTRSSSTAKVSKYLAPVNISGVICVGLNYRQHAIETGAKEPQKPVIFMKNLSSVAAHLEDIVIPTVCQTADETDYECELAIIIGKKCKNASESEALNFVLGYTCANDVSARSQQTDPAKSGSQWCRGKSFDTFAPIGPTVVTNIADPQTLRISTKLNGETVQDSNTADMIFSVKQIIAFLSQSTTLLPGTLILTGTPQGVGFTRKPPLWLHEGDKVDIIIEKIGTLTNHVVSEKAK